MLHSFIFFTDQGLHWSHTLFKLTCWFVLVGVRLFTYRFHRLQEFLSHLEKVIYVSLFHLFLNHQVVLLYALSHHLLVLNLVWNSHLHFLLILNNHRTTRFLLLDRRVYLCLVSILCIFAGLRLIIGSHSGKDIKFKFRLK